MVSPHDDVSRLERWIAAGGEWRVLTREAGTVSVALLTCDAGEEMDRIVSADSAFAAYVDAREQEQP